MKKKSIFLGLLIAGASFFALSSCGSKKTDNNDSNKTSDSGDNGGNLVLTKPTVTFETNGGSSIASLEVDEEGKITKPDNPTKESTAQYDFSFNGWFKDQLFAEPFDFDNDTISESTTLYAKWDETVREYEVTFTLPDGNSTTQTVEYGANPTFPTNPTKESDSNALYKFTYEFDGWYDANDVKYISDTPIQGDVVLTPKFKVKTISLNMSTTTKTDVTSLINENNLSDVMSYTGYDMVTFVKYYSSTDSSVLKAYSYYIDEKDNIIPVLKYTKAEVEEIVGKYNINASYIYLPAVLANTKDYSLFYNGYSFEYKKDSLTIYYSLDGYIMSFGNYTALYDTIYDEKPNLKYIDGIKKATAYELYYESNPSKKYTCVLDGDYWKLSESAETNDEARFFLEQSRLTFSEVYENMKRFGDFSARKENNYYIVDFTSKSRNFELTYDENGYLRKIVITIYGEIDEVTTIYSNPTSFELINKVYLEKFINDIFNATNKVPGYLHAEITEGTKYASVDYYIDGKLLVSGPAISAVVAEYIDPNNKADLIGYMLSLKNANIAYDMNNNLYIISGTDSNDITFELYFDAYGQPVKLIRKNGTSTMVANITYDLSTYGRITIYGADQEDVFVPLDKPLTYIPSKAGQEVEEDIILANVFVGYYFDQDFKQPYNPEKDKVEAGMKLYACYKEELQHSVKWHADPTNYNNVTITYVSKGELATPISSPNYEGFEFAGWYFDKDFKDVADFNIPGIYEYYARFIPETYSNFIIVGNNKVGNISDSLESIESVGTFTYVGSIGIMGKVETTVKETAFETTIYEQSFIRIELDDYANVLYTTVSKSSNGAALLFLDTSITAGDKLSSKHMYIKNGKTTSCTNGQIAEEGVEYWLLVDGNNVDSGELQIKETGLKRGTFLIVQAATAYLVALEIAYKQ